MRTLRQEFEDANLIDELSPTERERFEELSQHDVDIEREVRDLALIVYKRSPKGFKPSQDYPPRFAEVTKGYSGRERIGMLCFRKEDVERHIGFLKRYQGIWQRSRS